MAVCLCVLSLHSHDGAKNLDIFSEEEKSVSSHENLHGQQNIDSTVF